MGVCRTPLERSKGRCKASVMKHSFFIRYRENVTKNAGKAETRCYVEVEDAGNKTRKRLKSFSRNMYQTALGY